jgi:hypothetical protein
MLTDNGIVEHTMHHRKACLKGCSRSSSRVQNPPQAKGGDANYALLYRPVEERFRVHESRQVLQQSEDSPVYRVKILTTFHPIRVCVRRGYTLH